MRGCKDHGSTGQGQPRPGGGEDMVLPTPSRRACAVLDPACEAGAAETA